MNVTYNFEYDWLDDTYKDILVEIYAERLQFSIFTDTGEGYTGVGACGLIHKQCFGCQFQCSSQKHHDVCLLPFEDQIEFLIDYGLGEVNEVEITQTFIRHLSESGKVPSISLVSPHRHLLDGQWRQNEWLTLFVVRHDIINRIVCMEYFRRKEIDPKQTDVKG